MIKNILIFFCIIFSLLCYADSWEKKDVKNTPPKERSSYTITKMGNDYYLFGGCDDVTFWRFNDSDNSFTLYDKFDSEDQFTGHVAVYFSNQFCFLFGKRNNAMNDKIYVNDKRNELNPEDIEIEDTDLTLPRQDFAGVVYGKELYIFGGRTDDNNTLVGQKSAFIILTHSNNKWKAEEVVVDSHSKSPKVRYGHKMIAKGRDFYLFGGQNGNTFYNDVWKYDADTQKWEELVPKTTSIPKARAFSTIALTETESESKKSLDLWITGGIAPNDEYLSDTWRFNLDSKTWKKKKSAPVAHAQTESMLIAEKDDKITLAIFAGKSSSSNYVTNQKVYIYNSTISNNDDDDDDDDNHVHVFCGMLGIEFLGIIFALTILHNFKKKS